MAEPAVPQHLGRFQVIRHLATGGMAELLLAMDGSRHVVIKRIRGEQARDAEFVKMFLSEARLAGSLRHEHVVEVFEIGEQSGEYFFAMEHVHGEDLRRVLLEVNKRDDQVPIAQIIAIMCAAAAGLHHAHEKRGPDREPLGIVHRDVSPANILVGYDGTVKVADFGIAKAVLRQLETRSGTLRGKVSYMSPEQVTGRAIDRRSDVFALGIVLYEIATARRLFKGDNDFLVMSTIVQGHFPKPSLLRADLPRALEDIIMKALEINPGARYQTADELRCALDDFAASIGMRPNAKSVADYMRKLFGQRNEAELDDEPTISAPFDFDGSASGVVPAPQHAPSKFKASPSSLIAIAHAEEAQGGGTPMAWSKPGRPRSRSIVIAAVATVMVAVGGFTITKLSISDPAPATPTSSETPQVMGNAAEPSAAAAPAVPAEVAAEPPTANEAPQPAPNPAIDAAAKKRAAQEAAAQAAVDAAAKQQAAKDAAAAERAAKQLAKEAAAAEAAAQKQAAKEAAVADAAAKKFARDAAAADAAAKKRAARDAAAADAAAKKLATDAAAADAAAKKQAARDAAAADAAAKKLATDAAAADAAAKKQAARDAAAADAAKKQQAAREHAAAKHAAEKDAAARRTAAKAKKDKPADKKPAEKKWTTKTLFPE